MTDGFDSLFMYSVDLKGAYIHNRWGEYCMMYILFKVYCIDIQTLIYFIFEYLSTNMLS